MDLPTLPTDLPLAKLLRTTRLKRDLGVRETARCAGISPSYYSSLEMGKGSASPRAAALVSLAKVLELPLAVLRAAAVRQKLVSIAQRSAELEATLAEYDEQASEDCNRG